jgi:hypothetical protein
MADAVLIAHFAVVVFIVGGFLLILAGGALQWRWVRRRGFRIVHLAAIAFVALESLLGMRCPLTVLEHSLRADGSTQSFVGYWVARLLYYEFPEWVFALAYVAFACAVAAAWWYVPPQRRQGMIGA